MPVDIPEQLHLVESFANSMDVDSAQDDLDSPARFGRWLAAHGFPGVEPADGELASAVGLRDALRDELIAHHAADLRPARPGTGWTGYAEQIPLRASFRPRARPLWCPPAGCDRVVRRGAGRDGAGRARGRLAPAQDLPGGDLPAGVLRQVQEPVEDVVLDAGVRQPQQDPDLSGPATRSAARCRPAAAALAGAAAPAAWSRSGGSHRMRSRRRCLHSRRRRPLRLDSLAAPPRSVAGAAATLACASGRWSLSPPPVDLVAPLYG